MSTTTDGAYFVPVPPSRPPRQTPLTRQVNYRLPITVTQRLEAAAAVLGQSQAKIIADAVGSFLDSLPAQKRRLIDEILAVRQKP